MKAFVKSTEAWNQEQTELQERLLKAKTPKTYWCKFYMEYYYFYQQYKDYFEIFNAIRMNETLFALLVLRGFISFRFA